MQNGCFYCWCKSLCWKYIFGVANQMEIWNPILESDKISENFRVFPWSLETTVEIVRWILSVPLLSMSFPCHQSLPPTYLLLCCFQLIESLNQLQIQTQQQWRCRLLQYLHTYILTYLPNLMSYIRLFLCFDRNGIWGQWYGIRYQ